MHLWGWAAELTVWAVPEKDLPYLLSQCQTVLLLFFFTVDCLVDWMIGSLKKQFNYLNLFTKQTGALACRRMTITAWHLLFRLVISLVTHCCGMPSHSSTAFVASHPTWLCRSLWDSGNSSPMLIPQVLNGVEECWHVIPSSPSNHLGGEILIPDCGAMELSLVLEFHVSVCLHWDCLQYWQALFFK